MLASMHNSEDSRSQRTCPDKHEKNYTMPVEATGIAWEDEQTFINSKTMPRDK